MSILTDTAPATRKAGEVLTPSPATIRDAQLSATLGRSIAAFAQCDLQGRFVFVNEAFCALVGRSRSELLGLRMQDVTHPEEVGANAELYKRCLNTGEPFTIEKRYVRPNGAVVWVNNSVTPILGPDGRPSGALAMCLETTDSRAAEEARRQAEEALRGSEEFSRSIVESSPDCVKVLDPAGVLLFMNRNGQCAMEIDDFAALQGRRWYDLWPEETRPQIETALDTARKGETSRFSAFCPTAKGTPKWWDVTVTPVLDPRGQPERLISISRDVTPLEIARRKLESEQKRLLELFEQAPGFMAVVRGPEHVFELSNAAHRRTIGGREVTGLSIRQAFPELEGQGYYELFDQAYTTGEAYIGRGSPVMIQRSSSGPPELGYFDFVLQPIRDSDGQVTGIFIQGHEVTEQKRIEQELRTANEELQRFAYIVSHDLRSPLVNVMGFTTELDAARADLARFFQEVAQRAPELAGGDIKRIIETDLPEAIQFIRSSTIKMDRLINAILKLSREGGRILAPEPIDMGQLLDGHRATITHQLQEKRAEFVIGDVPNLLGDRVTLDQIFGNLIDNAVKYLDPKRPGRITVRGYEVGPNVRYEIEDNGRGIDPKDFDRIFDLFRRAGAQDQPGEGIGLAHVRALVRRLGGSISVSSEVGVGSRFTVTLPKVQSVMSEAE